MVKSSGNRGRPKTIDTSVLRNRIIDAAHGCFVHHGFGKTTTAMIASEAKISKRDLYRQFSTKTEIFGEVVRARRQAILDLPRPADEQLAPLDALCRIFRLDLDDQAAAERDAMLNFVARESLQYPELSDLIYDTGIIRSREELIEWLEDQKRDGTLHISDTVDCAGLMMDVVFGAMLPRRRLKDPVDREWQSQMIRGRLAIILKGLQAK
ncbi:transcriptional regulator, TetR family [Cohaesibacter marisflavi]|uniref:Transcriptional regulator, TetR family n=1 Tax=Cohaesibacter marisflavi TaxID=655353 RepID=A0A1I5M2J9_9HYPH|nr:TetR/AcrR family transcriptional regulator [Cohaesibacter marisflavi]SFP03693.1 transcriptional regulator, TetR family [Cohaesibacter marisflavi]